MIDSFLASILSSRFKRRLDPSIQIVIKERNDNSAFQVILDWYHMVHNPKNNIIDKIDNDINLGIQVDNWSYEITENILEQEPNKIISKNHLLLMLNEKMTRTIQDENYHYAADLRDRIKYIEKKFQ